jgi:hypothetical protein
MKTEKNNGTTERRNFENGSTENLISEILQLVQEQKKMLGKGAISPEWASEYKSRAWQIRQLLDFLRHQWPTERASREG